MEWLLLLLVPVVLLMLAVQLLPVAFLPDAVRRFRQGWRSSGWAPRLMIVFSIVLGLALAVALQTGGGGWLAYALLGFVAVPVVYGALMPLVLFVQHRHSRRR